ncbi:MAG: HEPN domain-containing protein [bacterium]
MNGRIDIVNRWITKADHDLGTAKITFEHISEYHDTIAFHCQQAVEKYIKSILIFFDIDFLHSHNLVYLLDLLKTKYQIEDIWFYRASKLQEYSVEIRYPDTIIELTNDDLIEAISIAEAFRVLALERIQKS